MSLSIKNMNCDYIVSYNNKEVLLKDIVYQIKIGDAISSSLEKLRMSDFTNILHYVNDVQNKTYKTTMFGDPLVMVFC
jgi:hypothetical protein